MRNFAFIFIQLALMLLLTSSCSNGPKPINYGSDACAFCQMIIVDKQHAAQLVTEKGKNYKYDAIECMINDLSKWKRPPVKSHLVADYANPGTLTDALTASYLISEEIPSPMGAFLSAFSKVGKRDEIQKDSGGERLTWDQLRHVWGKEHTYNHH